MRNMMLQARNFKLILAALLIGAAGSLSAQSYSSGLFSVGPNKHVHFATSNYTEPGTGREFFRWSEIASIEAAGHTVLTLAEWNYLYSSRPHAYELFALATVKEEQGLVILPDYDTWVLPAGCGWNYKETGGGYGKNVYDASQWAQMEAAGAIFLPARGYSDGSTTYDQGIHGTYWVNTEDELNDNNAYRIQFDNGYFFDIETRPKETAYYSIRTLHEDPAILFNETDEAAAFATKLASARSSSPTEAYIIRTLKKDGTYYTLTLPFDVPDINTSPLAGAEVFSFTSASVGDNNNLILDITPVGSALYQSTPYLIRWDNSGETIKLMHFTDLTLSNWDSDTEASDAGTGDVKFRGFYPKTHIVDSTDAGTHLYLFIGDNNQFFWPVVNDKTSMKGFRAYFRITPSGGGAAHAPIRRGMSASLRIRSVATAIEEVQRENQQSQKILLNGQIVIINNGNIYTLNGQKL